MGPGLLMGESIEAAVAHFLDSLAIAQVGWTRGKAISGLFLLGDRGKHITGFCNHGREMVVGNHNPWLIVDVET